MIGPSQRRLPAKLQSDPLSLHERLSRKKLWHWRLHVCSGAALLASVVAWALGLPLGLHAALVAASFALGFLWPIRAVAPWALGWIESRAGYSYRTALELTLNGRNDPFGFADAVRERAAARAARLELEPPTLQPWWLPALVLALVLLLLPSMGFGGSGLFGTPPSASPPAPPASPPAVLEETEEALEEEALEEEPTDDAARAEDEDDQPAQEEAADPTRDDAEPEDHQLEQEVDAPEAAEDPGDSETLSRFLEEMRDSPRADDEQDVAELSEAERAIREDVDREDGVDADSAEVLERGDAAEGEPEAGEEAPGDDEALAEAEQRLADTVDDAEADAGEGLDETDDAAGEPAADELAAEDDGVGPDDALSEAEAPAGDEHGAPDEDMLAEGEDELGDGAGSLPSPPQPTPGLEPEELEDRDVEHLPGRIGEGPSTVGGEVRLPGTPNGDLPEGEAREQYERAVERAVTEGRIPVEYQEILREYFR